MKGKNGGKNKEKWKTKLEMNSRRGFVDDLWTAAAAATVTEMIIDDDGDGDDDDSVPLVEIN